MSEADKGGLQSPGDVAADDVSPDRQSPASQGANSPSAGAEGSGPHDWSAFYDQSGQIYYYNNVTGESSWDEPEKFNPPPAEADGDDGGDKKGETTEPQQTDNNREDEAISHEADAVEPSGGQWTVHQDDEGREYYYNADTGETQWEKPDSFQSLHPSDDTDLSPSSAPEVSSPPASPTATHSSSPEATMKEETKEAEEQVEEEIDPGIKKLQDAEKALNEPDAVMEPACWGNVLTVVEGLGQAEGGKKAMQALVASFNGRTAVCGLLTRWLGELQTESFSKAVQLSAANMSKEAADNTREIVQDVMTRIAKEGFTKTGGDNILSLDKKAVSFLEDMMDSKRWRSLLIDLSATNKDSALLMYCLESISKRGHHREIARRINQSDHFAVYNAMLASEFAVIGKAAVSACDDGDLVSGIDGLVADLKRSCTSTSYTYFYATELLRDLISVSKRTTPTEGLKSPRAHRAVGKWERLKEELENAMVDPSVASDGASPLFRKRRLDVALAVSELYQRQRRRRKPSPSDIIVEKANGNSSHGDSLETALLNLLKRNYLGTRLDDRLLDQMLQEETSLGSTGEIGKLLISHPLAIKVLLGHLFKPGASRAGSAHTKQKLARLVALAVIAAENNRAGASKSVDATDQSDGTDELSVTKMILSASDLCARVENMVSFTVSEDAVKAGDDSSPGRKLSTLAMSSACVAQGVAMWATEIARGPEFVTSASYPTLTPSMLSLLRLIGSRHPFTRRSILEVTFIFLKHSNSDISYQKMNEIKEQSLRLLLLLLVKGEVSAVLGELSKRLKQQGNSEIDASLVRYFVSGLLDILRPPLSMPLVRSLGQMLSAPRCMEALKSPYFGQPNKQKLVAVLNCFNDALSCREKCSAKDSELVESLVSAYM